MYRKVKTESHESNLYIHFVYLASLNPDICFSVVTQVIRFFFFALLTSVIIAYV